MGNYFLQNYKIYKYFLKIFYEKYFVKKSVKNSDKSLFITKFTSVSLEKNSKKN